MLALFRDSATQAPSLIPKPDPGPDWLALIDLLRDLQQPVDNAGETILTTAEAAKLRDLGWSASKGRWFCPTIPWQHVRLYPFLWHLADNLDPASRPIPWHPKRAVFHQISSIDPLSDDEHRLLRTLHNAPRGRLRREELLHAVSWRISARLLDHLLGLLCDQNYITITADGWISGT